MSRTSVLRCSRTSRTTTSPKGNYVIQRLVPKFDTLNELKLNKELQKEARKYIQKLKEVKHELCVNVRSTINLMR